MGGSNRRARGNCWNAEQLEGRVLLAGHPVRVAYAPTDAGGFSDPVPVLVPAIANPVISSISPDTVIVGGPAFTLTVSGNNFTSTGVIAFNGTSLTTTATAVGGGQFSLSATVPAGSIGATGTSVITVKASGTNSNSVALTIRRPEVVGYLPDYEFDAFPSIDLSDVTQINYFDVVPSSTGVVPSTSETGYTFDGPDSQLNTLVAAAHGANPRVAVNITLGPSAPFQLIANDVSGNSQNTLVTQLISFCNTHHLDGIDMDYEPANTLSGTDQANYVALLTQLHNATSAAGLTLTAAVQAWQQIIPQANTGIIDRYYVMDYDLENGSSAPYDESITYLQSWMSYGIPLSKILMGVPFYGRTGTATTSTPEAYGTILSDYANAHGGAYPAASVDTANAGGFTWGYNGIATMQKKAAYVLSHGMGGMFAWELGQDHFNGTTGKYDQYSLLPAVAADVLGVVHLNSSGSGAITLTQDSDHLHVDWTAGNWTGTFPAGDLAGLKLFGDGASDTVVLKQNAGNPLPSVMHLNGTFTISGLSGIDPFAGKTLEIGKSTVYLAYASAANDPIANIRADLHTGYNNGNWAATTTSGVITSLASAADGSHASGIGYGDSAQGTLFGSLPVNTIELKYVLYGDTALQGSSGPVGFNDFMRMTQHFTATSGATWQQGDFNYDGAVNNADFVLLKANYGSTLTASSQAPAAAMADVAAPQLSAVPVTETDQMTPSARKHKKHR